MRKYWTKQEVDIFVKIYPHTITNEMAVQFNCTMSQVYNKATKLELKKTPEYLAINGGRIKESNINTQFRKGQKAWNKGMKGLHIGGVETQFKKGHKPPNWKPIGYRSIRDGYLVEKTDKGFQFVHILLWKQYNQEIPKGMFVVFKDRNKMNITIENLELIDRAENMRRNSYVNLPEEIKEVIHIKKQITRKINSYGKK